MKHSDVIDEFLRGDFKDGRGTLHLKMHREEHGWSLINYITPILYKRNMRDMYIMNMEWYSRTTSKIQRMILYKLDGRSMREVNGPTMQQMLEQ